MQTSRDLRRESPRNKRGKRCGPVAITFVARAVFLSSARKRTLRPLWIMQTPFCERQTIAQTVNSSINLARARLNLLILNPRDATQPCSQNALKVVSDKKKIRMIILNMIISSNRENQAYLCIYIYIYSMSIRSCQKLFIDR